MTCNAMTGKDVEQAVRTHGPFLQRGRDTPGPEGRLILHLEALRTFSTSKTHEQRDHFPTHALPLRLNHQ